MSYIRPLENESGIYIYPHVDGYVQFHFLPNNEDAKIPDDLLDILLYLMNDKEVNARRKHGKMLLNLLDQKDYDTYIQNRNCNFKEWEEKI